MYQENMTTDFTALANGKRTGIEKTARKSRSKSIGPGGLDALTDTSGNRRKVGAISCKTILHIYGFLFNALQSLASLPQSTPKSILKLTMPPLREIPAHKSARAASPKKSTLQHGKENEVTVSSRDATSLTKVTGADSLPNPFEIQERPAPKETRVSLRTEEEQQAAARERDEKERRELEKEVISRRDARRKSLANRRVSFAPEATLHTWDVVVEYQDSTASSSSTRRASSASGISAASPQPSTPGPNSDASEPPSTPPEQVEEETITATPEHQRDLHQKKRRRSSAIPPMNFNNPDDEFMSSSPFSGDSVGDDEIIVEDDGANSNSESSDDDGTTMMSLDGGETTDMSLASVKSNSSTGSDRLDKALKDAARQAGTRGIDYDENGEQSEDESVVASFVPWSHKNTAQNLESSTDQENINPFGNQENVPEPLADIEGSEGDEMTMDMTGAFGGILPAQETQDQDELSMDVTRAFGNIIPTDAPKLATNRRKSVGASRRQSLRRKSSEQDLDDETMEFTMAVGGIQSRNEPVLPESEDDMTMDFTTAVGGVLAQPKSPQRNNRRTSVGSSKTQPRKSLGPSQDEDATMDMTVAVGGIMPSITVRSPVQDEDATMGMDMTTAIGGILQSQVSTEDRTHARKVMELEADLGSSPFKVELSRSPTKALPGVHAIASETGSPSFAAFKGNGIRRSTEPRASTTPKSLPSVGGTPVKKPSTPSKQLTPQPQHSAIPSKTPPSKNVVMRTSSPKRLFRDEIKAASTPQSTRASTAFTPNRLFQQDKATGVATPNFVLTPKQRRSSGLGLDKAGLGSPRVSAILDRRRSIGEHAKSFTPNRIHTGVRFEDPRIMENEIDDERAQEMAKEDGRTILEREVDQTSEEKDVTLNLKEMIQSLTPKKKSTKGRKSLHVGAATGVLGKRPIELDEDEDDEDEGGVKRLKGHQGSPVKNVRLQGPPTKAETTGRMTRANRASLDATSANITPTIQSPLKSKATTPQPKGRFRDADINKPIPPPTEKLPVDEPQIEEDDVEPERLQLQEFLNMTSIRFMELTTTKRRHTIAPRSSAKEFIDDTPASLEDCVAAGASTIPMLELFQHVSFPLPFIFMSLTMSRLALN